MKRYLKYVIFIAVLSVSFIIFSAFISSEDGKSAAFKEDESKIAACILNGEEAFESIGVLSEETESIAALNESENTVVLLDADQKTKISSNLNNELNMYFSENIATRYAEKNDSNMDYYLKVSENPDLQTSISVAVRSGVLDFALTELKVNGTTAEAKGTFVGWHLWIESAEINGELKYLLTMTMSKYENTYILTETAGNWKISETGERYQEFAPDSFDYEKGTFNTYEEALATAKTIVPEDENPF